VRWSRPSTTHGSFYVRQEEHLGLNEHFNRCYELAETEYMFLIPDDDLMKSTLEQTIAVLDANPRVGVVHGCARLVDGSGTMIVAPHHMTQLEHDEIETAGGLHSPRGRSGLSHPTLRPRASGRARSPTFRLRDDDFPVTDVGLWLQLALSWDIAFLARTLAVVCIHPGAYTADGRGVTTGGYVQQVEGIEKLVEVKLRFVDEYEDRLQDADALRRIARRARRRDLLDFAGHKTIPERWLFTTARTLGELGRRDPSIFGEARAWRLLGASLLGHRTVEANQGQEAGRVGRGYRLTPGASAVDCCERRRETGAGTARGSRAQLLSGLWSSRRRALLLPGRRPGA